LIHFGDTRSLWGHGFRSPFRAASVSDRLAERRPATARPCTRQRARRHSAKRPQPAQLSGEKREHTHIKLRSGRTAGDACPSPALRIFSPNPP